MHNQSIALIAPSDSAASHAGWWGTVAAAWPGGGETPTVEHLTPESVLSTPRALKPGQAWDAAVIAPLGGTPDPILYRLIDVLQQALVPIVVIQDALGAEAPQGRRLNGFNPGAVMTHALDSAPAQTAGILFALAQRQHTVRSLDQSIRMAQSFQGETAAEIDKLHQELLLAAKVQRDFLPKRMPMVDGVECSVLYRPAGFVSGDTYDVSQLDENHIGFFLADAMGHGVPAALMTLYISGSIPRKEIGPNGYRLVPPAESLQRLNAELADSVAGPARFATAICGVIDVRTSLITLAAAGHPPPLRIGRHGVRPVNVSGMLLGVVPDFEYQQTTIRLEEDEILVIHSDGIEPAFACRAKASDVPVRPIPPHFAHLASMRRNEALASLGAAMDRLALDLDNQSGSLHQDDDVTVLAFQTTSVREPLRSAAPAAV